MTIYLKNTLTKEKEEFAPIEDGKVSLYSCGPTVYNAPTIGNMRSYIFSDTIRRAFEYNGYEVKQVINITDVGHLTDDEDQGEDKMEKSAKEKGKSAKEIAEMYTEMFFNDLHDLNIETEGTIFPKATGHISDQIHMISELEDKGLTYKTSDGIYFDTGKLDDYGKLGQINKDGLQEGARVEKNSEKKNPTDFALWKFSGETNRQQEWDSPWGRGFPGWHIECSAMAQKYLGKMFDVHTGGIDHIPTHHNNEIAQTENVNGNQHVNYWMHHNHILIDGEKMSKSLGNTYTINDLKEKGISPLAYRYWILTSDYKTLVNFTFESIIASQTALNKLIEHLKTFEDGGSISENYREKFIEKINNDLNTAEAIALIWELIKDKEVHDADKRATILDFDKVLGLDLEKQILIEVEIPKDVQELINEREEARKSGDFKKSDKLRDEILEKGFIVKDTENGPKVSGK